jgi:hypothetical protein
MFSFFYLNQVESLLSYRSENKKIEKQGFSAFSRVSTLPYRITEQSEVILLFIKKTVKRSFGWLFSSIDSPLQDHRAKRGNTLVYIKARKAKLWMAFLEQPGIAHILINHFNQRNQ